MKRLLSVIMMLGLCLLLCACQSGGASAEKIRDMEFTLVASGDVPADIQRLIDEKKANEFQITYSDGEYKYIVIGYGEQATGGFSIKVSQLYLTQDNICIQTTLEGPTSNDEAGSAKSYPFIVIKIENIDNVVIFL